MVEPGISFSTVGVTYAWCFKRSSVRMMSLALLKGPILWSATLMMVTVSPSCCMSVCFLYSAKVAFATEPDHCQLRKVSKATTMMVHESISRFDVSNSFPILSTISLKSLHMASLWMIALPSSHSPLCLLLLQRAFPCLDSVRHLHCTLQDGVVGFILVQSIFFQSIFCRKASNDTRVVFDLE